MLFRSQKSRSADKSSPCWTLPARTRDSRPTPFDSPRSLPARAGWLNTCEHGCSTPHVFAVRLLYFAGRPTERTRAQHVMCATKAVQTRAALTELDPKAGNVTHDIAECRLATFATLPLPKIRMHRVNPIYTPTNYRGGRSLAGTVAFRDGPERQVID